MDEIERFAAAAKTGGYQPMDWAYLEPDSIELAHLSNQYSLMRRQLDAHDFTRSILCGFIEQTDNDPNGSRWNPCASGRSPSGQYYIAMSKMTPIVVTNFFLLLLSKEQAEKDGLSLPRLFNGGKILEPGMYSSFRSELAGQLINAVCYLMFLHECIHVTHGHLAFKLEHPFERSHVRELDLQTLEWDADNGAIQVLLQGISTDRTYNLTFRNKIIRFFELRPAMRRLQAEDALKEPGAIQRFVAIFANAAFLKLWEGLRRDGWLGTHPPILLRRQTLSGVALELAKAHRKNEHFAGVLSSNAHILADIYFDKCARGDWVPTFPSIDDERHKQLSANWKEVRPYLEKLKITPFKLAGS